MIEKIVYDYLIDNGISAYMEIPESFPAPPFVLIEKTSGGGAEHISFARLAIQSYGATLYAAAQLNEQVKTLMENMVELDEVCKVSLNSDYNFTDTATKRYRYQAVFDITHY